MPKIPSNYSKCVIYKLVCYDTTLTDCYVGHTTNFTERKRYHKNAYFNENHSNHSCPVYGFMKKHGGWENFVMLQIEEFPCETKREAEAREEHWRKELKATLNGKQAFTTIEERRIQVSKGSVKWRKKNPTYDKAYKDANKEKIQQQRKEYYQRKKLKKLNLNKEIPETNIIEK
jgi:hypothetical protein